MMETDAPIPSHPLGPSFPHFICFPPFYSLSPPTFSLLSPHFSAGAVWLHCEHSHRRWPRDPFALHCCHWARQRVLSVKSCFFAQDDQSAGRTHFSVKVCFKADEYHTYSQSLINTYIVLALAYPLQYPAQQYPPSSTLYSPSSVSTVQWLFANI